VYPLRGTPLYLANYKNQTNIKALQTRGYTPDNPYNQATHMMSNADLKQILNTVSESLSNGLLGRGETPSLVYAKLLRVLDEKELLPKQLKGELEGLPDFASSQARNLALEKKVVFPDGFKGSSKTGKVNLADVQALVDTEPEAPVSKEEPKATHWAKEHAKDLGVDLSDVEGSGVGGKITKGDVERHSNSSKSSDSDSEKPSSSKAKGKKAAKSTFTYTATDAARRLIKEHNISDEDVQAFWSVDEKKLSVKDIKTLIADTEGTEEDSDED